MGKLVIDVGAACSIVIVRAAGFGGVVQALGIGAGSAHSLEFGGVMQALGIGAGSAHSLELWGVVQALGIGADSAHSLEGVVFMLGCGAGSAHWLVAVSAWLVDSRALAFGVGSI